MPNASTFTQSPRTAQIATMVDYLRPHAVSMATLWDAMPAAFLYATGREVVNDDAHDLFICHAVVDYFPELAHPEPVSYERDDSTMVCFERISDTL